MSTTFGKCPDCPKESRSVRLWGEGVCLYHFRNPPPKKTDNKADGVFLNKGALEGLVADVVAGPTRTEKYLLDQFYREQAAQLPAYCEEPGCRCRLVASQTWRIKAMIAHVVPKRHFKSVMVHPLNRLFMCKTPHHDDYDSSWDKAQHMAIWPVAVERFQVFMHLITDKELRFLPPALRELTKR